MWKVVCLFIINSHILAKPHFKIIQLGKLLFGKINPEKAWRIKKLRINRFGQTSHVPYSPVSVFPGWLVRVRYTKKGFLRNCGNETKKLWDILKKVWFSHLVLWHEWILPCHKGTLCLVLSADQTKPFWWILRYFLTLVENTSTFHRPSICSSSLESRRN